MAWKALSPGGQGEPFALAGEKKTAVLLQIMCTQAETVTTASGLAPSAL